MTARKHYDVAIIGLGTMGSFAALELARRGFSVVGFDQFRPPHSRGSHSGGTRIYRIAYPEGTGYVKLAQRAGDLWEEASEQLGAKLLYRTGMLYMGPSGEPFLQNVQDSATSNQLQVETISAREVYRRYPAFEIPEHFSGILDPRAGWLDVDASIQASQTHATSLGVDCFFDQPVRGWKATEDHVAIHLESGTIAAQSLVVTAGAWAGQLLQELDLPLTIRRKVIAWFEPVDTELFGQDRIPVFTFPENLIYGFPNVPGMGVKMAEHCGGIDVINPNGPVQVPVARDLDPIRDVARKYIPQLARAKLERAVTCLYTLTPDEHFIVDHHPQFRNVLFAAGFSGHGFKFAPLIAIALADLVQDGRTSLPIEFMSLGRLSSEASRLEKSAP